MVFSNSKLHIYISITPMKIAPDYFWWLYISISRFLKLIAPIPYFIRIAQLYNRLGCRRNKTCTISFLAYHLQHVYRIFEQKAILQCHNFGKKCADCSQSFQRLFHDHVHDQAEMHTPNLWPAGVVFNYCTVTYDRQGHGQQTMAQPRTAQAPPRARHRHRYRLQRQHRHR